tara:strand:- start:236 stop:709 length:474 start_codon:yes stop_codon:yes gene_type:complete
MRIILTLIILVIVQSCKDFNNKKPENLISEDKMVEILFDLEIINAARGDNKKIIEEKISNINNYLQNKYKIGIDQFENSISYYSSDILKYSMIIQEVEQKLDSTKNLIEKKINAKRNRQDSLINISKGDTGDLKKNNYTSSPIYREKKLRKNVQKSH